MRKILLIAFAMLSVLTASSQVDPTLAGMILIYKEKAEKTLKSIILKTKCSKSH